MATWRGSGDNYDKRQYRWSDDCEFDFAAMRIRRNETADKEKQPGVFCSRLCVAVG